MKIQIDIAFLGAVAHGKSSFVAAFADAARSLPGGHWKCENISPQAALQLQQLVKGEPLARTNGSDEIASLERPRDLLRMRLFALTGELNDIVDRQVAPRLARNFHAAVLIVNPFILLTEEERLNTLYRIAHRFQLQNTELTAGQALSHAVTACFSMDANLSSEAKLVGGKINPEQRRFDHRPDAGQLASEIEQILRRLVASFTKSRPVWASYQVIMEHFRNRQRGAMLVFSHGDLLWQEGPAPTPSLEELRERFRKLVSYDFEACFYSPFMESTVSTGELKSAPRNGDAPWAAAREMLTALMGLVHRDYAQGWMQRRRRLFLFLQAPFILMLAISVGITTWGSDFHKSDFFPVAWVISIVLFLIRFLIPFIRRSKHESDYEW